LLAVLARRLVRCATFDLPVLGFALYDSGPVGAVGTLAALSGIRPPASAMVHRATFNLPVLGFVL